MLQFGTEVVTARDGSISGLLGASPGASVAVHIMLEVLRQSFPSQFETWKPREKYEFILAGEYKKKTLTHNLIY